MAIALVVLVTAIYGGIYFRYTQDTPAGEEYLRPKRHGGLEVTSQRSFWAMTLLDLGLLVSLGLLTYPLAQNKIHFLNAVQVALIWVLGLLYAFQFYKAWQVNREIAGSLNPFSPAFLQPSQHYPPNQRYQLRQIALLDFTYLTNFGSQIAVLSVLPTWFEQTFGLNAVLASVVAAAYPVLNLVSRPSGGLISDRSGSRKWTMTGLTMGIGIGNLLIGRLDQHSSLTGAITLTMCAYFVQAGAGATFGIVPLIRKSVTGQIVGRGLRQCGWCNLLADLQPQQCPNAVLQYGRDRFDLRQFMCFFLQEPRSSVASESPENVASLTNKP